MRTKLFVITLGFVMDLGAFAQPAVKTLEYRFDNGTTTGGTMVPYYVNPLLLSSASAFYAGSGVLPINTPMPGTVYVQGRNAPIPQATDRAPVREHWDPTFNLNDHYGFSMTPTVGFVFVTDSISFWTRRSSIGPPSIQFRTSVNSYGTTTWLGSNGTTDSWVRRTVIGAVPNIAATQNVRMYGYGYTGGLGTNGTWRLDTVRVYGHLQGVFNLPIELLSFTGAVEGDSVRLRWSTATETDNDHFTIEKSLDGMSWNELGTQPGAGTSLYRIDYVMFDTHPNPGWNYYRLRQTDVDGQSETFGPIAVHWLVDDGLTRIVDAFGREVQSWSETHNLTDLPRGWYIVESKYRPPRMIVIP